MKWLLILVCLCSSLLAVDSAVACGSCGGRFGDWLVHYLHARWVAYQHNLPFLYQPFPFSSELKLDENQLLLTDVAHEYNKITLESHLDIIPTSTLYLCSYFPEVQAELGSGEWCYSFKVNWKDPGFRRRMLELISPKKDLKLIFPPKEKVTIAIHYREGGRHDPLRTKVRTPLKFPPLSFFAKALQEIADYFPGNALYCFVFTDALKPADAVQELERIVIPARNIQFGFRPLENGSEEHVLEDFFSLFNFDVLIRPASNFSIVPSLLHDYAIVYSLERASFRGIYRVEQKNLEVNEPVYREVLSRVIQSNQKGV